jgi:hypothetical protein
MTGLLNAQHPENSSSTFGQAAGLVNGQIRYWVVWLDWAAGIEMAFDAGTSRGAGEASASFAASLAGRGATRRQLTADLTRYSGSLQVGGTPYVVIAAPLARGPFFFVLEIRPGAVIVGGRGAGGQGSGQHVGYGNVAFGLSAGPVQCGGLRRRPLARLPGHRERLRLLRYPLRRERQGERSAHWPGPNVLERVRSYVAFRVPVGRRSTVMSMSPAATARGLPSSLDRQSSRSASKRCRVR